MTHRFVDKIPMEIEDGVIYVSIPFETVIHKCCCGCSNEVVTPLSPADWSLIFNGESISLEPSIGNWSFPCRSHYWIKENRVVWSTRWSKREIQEGREKDLTDHQAYFEKPEKKYTIPKEESIQLAPKKSKKSFWKRLLSWNLIESKYPVYFCIRNLKKTIDLKQLQIENVKS